MKSTSSYDLTDAQNELYSWIRDYMREFRHSPSIRQMMQAMGLKSPAPIQSRLKHLQEKGFISWQEGKARTLQIVDEILEGVPIMGSVAAGGLIVDLLGILFGLIGYQALMGALFIQASSQTTGQLITATSDIPITGLEILSVLSNTQVIAAHFFGLCFSLWLLRRIYK